MAFDTTQLAYRNFRDILKQQTNQVVVWGGAGLSKPARLPDWPQLRDQLQKQAETQAELLEQEAKEKALAFLKLARLETNYWRAFSHLHQSLGKTTYDSAIKLAFADLPNAPIPKLYLQLWSLGIKGFLTLNLDRFAGKAFAQTHPGMDVRQFEGVNANHYIDVLRSGTAFIANLHGIIEDRSSWIFTEEELSTLTKYQGYKTFLETCFTARTILFVGISADDPGATRHLELLKANGIDLSAHYWLTNRNDTTTHEWAEQIGISQILYQSPDRSHSELSEFVEDLKKYVPVDTLPSPVVPSTRRERGVVLPPPEDVEQLKSNDIRIILNKEAVRILDSGNPRKLDEYNAFWKKYEESIYRAWSVSTTAGNRVFDYSLDSVIAKGAFGFVYRAKDSAGSTVAIKVLHGNVKEEPEMLEAFRRGVAAMKILSQRNVGGMVPYKAAWEIPPCAVMELIEGVNLQEAIESRYITTWEEILEISIQLVTILRTAHQLPERVLHRDVRPPNIMLRGYYSGSDDIEVVVLDFDLSWHRDASGLSVNLNKSSNGYVAPEQLDGARKKLTRNALVDSFGTGMTLFFIASGRQPTASEHVHRDWDKTLGNKIEGKKCPEWKSLPRRFARIIQWATQDTQSARWDMTRIQGELIRLKKCLQGPTGIDSLETLCEEIAARCRDLVEGYVWDLDRGVATVELNTGFTLRLGSEIDKQSLTCLLEWFHVGDRPYKDVKRFVGAASEKVCSLLKSSGWRVIAKQVAADRCRLEAVVPSRELTTVDSLQRLANGISSSLETLRFK